MPIRFACRRCDHINEAPTAEAGKRTSCGRCLEELTVPVPKPRAPAPASSTAGPAPSEMIRFACPRCSHTNEAPATAAGRRASCGRCLEDLTIPGTQVVESPPISPKPRPVEPKRPPAPAPRAVATPAPVVEAPKPRPVAPDRPRGRVSEAEPRALARSSPSPPPQPSKNLLYDDEADAAEGEAVERPLAAAREGRRGPSPDARESGSRRPSRDALKTLIALRPYLAGVGLLLAIASVPLMLFVAPGHLSPKGLMAISGFVATVGVLLAVGGTALSIVAVVKESFIHLFLFLIPGYFLYYLATRWNRVARPYFASLVGCLMMIVPMVNRDSPAVVAERVADDERKQAARDVEAAGLANVRRAESERALAARLVEPPPTPADALKRVGELKIDRSLVPQAELQGHDTRSIAVFFVLGLTEPGSDAKAEAWFRDAIESPRKLVRKIGTNREGRDVIFMVSPVTDPSAFARRITWGEAVSKPMPPSSTIGTTFKVIVTRPREIYGEPGSSPPPPPSPTLAAFPVGSTRRPGPSPPPMSLKKEGELEIPFPDVNFGMTAVFPATNADFVAIGGNGIGRGDRVSWDLRERRRVGLLRGIIPLREPYALSPDGTLLAGKGEIGGGGGVVIWSFLTDDVSRKIDLGPVSFDFLAFADKGRLVVGDANARTFQVWDVATGQPGATVRVPMLLARRTAAIAPDGTSLAVAASLGGNVGVFSLQDGRLLAEGRPYGVGDQTFVQPLGLAYSPDGKEVAGLFGAGRAARIMAWGVPGGKVLADCAITTGPVDISMRPVLYEGPALEYLPGVEGWAVFGRVVHDRLGGRAAGVIPIPLDEQQESQRHFLAPDRLTYVVGQPGRPIGLKSITLDLEGFRRAIAAMPPLTPPRPVAKPPRKP